MTLPSNETDWTPCPFCSGKYKLVGDPEWVAVHTMPSCRTFNAIDDALEFAVKARRAAGIPDLDEN